ncbi:hypothetical protein [Streptomyces sp. NPDC094049]|uniref:hypothetical protein n=1 Tax=Streptomyces sp. NPDC094049 TaxID=3154987 RepID=UPI00332F28AA
MLPVSLQQLVAYLKGCDVPARVHSQWIYVWLRHAGRGTQRSTRPGKSSVTQNLTADLAHIIQTGTVELERMDAVIRNLTLLVPEPDLSAMHHSMNLPSGQQRRNRQRERDLWIDWIGTPVQDTATGRSGILSDVAPDRPEPGDPAPVSVAWLRPVGGGREWTTDLAFLVPTGLIPPLTGCRLGSPVRVGFRGPGPQKRRPGPSTGHCQGSLVPVDTGRAAHGRRPCSGSVTSMYSRPRRTAAPTLLAVLTTGCVSVPHSPRHGPPGSRPPTTGRLPLGDGVDASGPRGLVVAPQRLCQVMPITSKAVYTRGFDT